MIARNARPYLGIVAALAVSLCGCGEGAASGLVEATEGLLAGGPTLLFSLSDKHKCSALINGGPSDWSTTLKDAPLQAASDDGSYTFGRVAPDKDTAYLVVASHVDPNTIAPGASVEFSALTGTVFAVGCRDFSATSGSRQDLDVVVFPAGLR